MEFPASVCWKEALMSNERYRRCPVCETWLSKKRYEKALGILQAKEKHIQHLQEEYQAKLRLLPEQKRLAAEKARQDERGRNKRLLAGRDEELRRLRERLRQIKRGTTPQTEGLEYEHILLKALREKFPDDDIQPTPGGQGGDILHRVQLARKPIGLILYECKRVRSILDDHVEQAYRAKQSREAAFAVLVTTGKKRGFDGLSTANDVIVVAPLGAIPLACLLRVHLIQIARTQATKEERLKIAQRLMGFINSPQFKNPLRDVMVRAEQLQKALMAEARAHMQEWGQRRDHYQRIEWDSSITQANLELVLLGKVPKTTFPAKPQPLALPGVSEK